MPLTAHFIKSRYLIWFVALAVLKRSATMHEGRELRKKYPWNFIYNTQLGNDGRTEEGKWKMEESKPKLEIIK